MKTNTSAGETSNICIRVHRRRTSILENAWKFFKTSQQNPIASFRLPYVNSEQCSPGSGTLRIAGPEFGLLHSISHHVLRNLKGSGPGGLRPPKISPVKTSPLIVRVGRRISGGWRASRAERRERGVRYRGSARNRRGGRREGACR